jgi:hypothetical protein
MDGWAWPADVRCRSTIALGPITDKVSPLQIMSKRIGREMIVFRFLGWSAKWMP